MEPSLRQRLQDLFSDAKFQRRLHLHLMWAWAGNIPVVVVTYFFLPDVWQAVSILYLALVSIYANFVGHYGSWQAARVEVRQEEIEQARQEALIDQTEEIVEKVSKIPPNTPS